VEVKLHCVIVYQMYLCNKDNMHRQVVVVN
jgi:hypothetical protein